MSRSADSVLTRNEFTKEGEDVRRFYPLRLQFDHLINFGAALTLRHVIDETSPLFGLNISSKRVRPTPDRNTADKKALLGIALYHKGGKCLER